MKGVIRLLAMIVLIAIISAVAVPVLAESWQTRYGPNTLQRGAKGIFVENMQMDLQLDGYEISVTGTYDQTSVNAIKAFQADHGLTINGVFNTTTKITLWNRIH